MEYHNDLQGGDPTWTHSGTENNPQKVVTESEILSKELGVDSSIPLPSFTAPSVHDGIFSETYKIETNTDLVAQ